MNDCERDLAGEATEMAAYRERLRNDISVEEANEEWELRRQEEDYLGWDYEEQS